MRHFFIFLITVYQKYISPYKGFRCAYGCYHKTLSCSAIIKNIITEQGLLAGWPLIKQQFKQCQTAYSLLINDDEQPPPPQNESSCYNKLKKEAKECAQEASCRCVGDIGSDCIPDLPCDANPCNYYTFKKSIHKKLKNRSKYDIRDLK